MVFGVLIGFYHGLIKVNKSAKTGVFYQNWVLIGFYHGGQIWTLEKPEKTRKNRSRCRKNTKKWLPMSKKRDFRVPDVGFLGSRMVFGVFENMVCEKKSRIAR
jgi:hypothetical protein